MQDDSSYRETGDEYAMRVLRISPCVSNGSPMYFRVPNTVTRECCKCGMIAFIPDELADSAKCWRCKIPLEKPECFKP